MKVMDKDLLDGLAARGFKLDWGDDNTGHQMKFRRARGLLPELRLFGTDHQRARSD
jgi:hypothetical protein